LSDLEAKILLSQKGGRHLNQHVIVRPLKPKYFWSQNGGRQ